MLQIKVDGKVAGLLYSVGSAILAQKQNKMVGSVFFAGYCILAVGMDAALARGLQELARNGFLHP